MKRGTSLLLVVTLMASVLAGALSVTSVSADSPSGTLYWDTFADNLLAEYQNDTNLVNFIDKVNDLVDEDSSYYHLCICFDDNSDNLTITVFHCVSSNSVYSVLYNNYGINSGISPFSNNTYQDTVNGRFYVDCCMKRNSEGYHIYQSSSLAARWLVSTSETKFTKNTATSTDSLAFPNTYNFNVSGRHIFTNFDVLAGADGQFIMSSNIVFDYEPPTVFPFDLKVFWLGERRYLTITDQSYIRNLDPDKQDYTWFLFNNPDEDYDLYDYRILTWDDISLIQGGDSFISGLSNVSPLGVYAYDITDLWWTDIQVSYLEEENEIVGVAMNTSLDFHEDSPEPGTNGTSDSYTEIYTNIYNYTTNYNTDPVVSQELAYQLSGGRAISSGLGYVNPPLQIKQWLGVMSLTQNTSWEYDLSRTGLDPDEMSMINFDILSVAIVPARGKVLDRFILHYWDYTLEYDSTFQTVPSQRISYCAYTDDLFEMYDLVIFCDTDADFLGDTWVPSSLAEDGLFGYTGDMTTAELLDGELSYWILTRSALQKAQLFTFCDGFSKMYDLVTQIANKNNLWNNSFFSWSMSIFHQLETLGGSLSHIDSLLTNLHLDQKLNDIIAGINRIGDNTDETQDPVWYVSLWNWVRGFTPSDDAFITGLNALDEGLNNIPALPAPTGSPGYPLLPTFTPTPSPDPGGV